MTLTAESPLETWNAVETLAYEASEIVKEKDRENKERTRMTDRESARRYFARVSGAISKMRKHEMPIYQHETHHVLDGLASRVSGEQRGFASKQHFEIVDVKARWLGLKSLIRTNTGPPTVTTMP